MYDVPAVAVNGTLARMVVFPFTLFWIMRLAPSIKALYQLLPFVQRNTSPKLLLLKALIEPVA